MIAVTDVIMYITVISDRSYKIPGNPIDLEVNERLILQMNDNSKKHSILIVDDDKTNIIALTYILEANYNVLSLLDSTQTVQLAENELPDLILLDILMPEMDGFEVITLLKLNEKTKNIPVIFITGLDNVKAEENGLMLGAADYIAKPFHPAIVKLRVENQIQRRN